VRKNKWTLPQKRKKKQPGNQPTQNLTVDPARVQVQGRRECRQQQRLTNNRMTHNRVPSQLRYQPVPANASVGADASTGSLFDMEPKNGN